MSLKIIVRVGSHEKNAKTYIYISAAVSYTFANHFSLLLSVSFIGGEVNQSKTVLSLDIVSVRGYLIADSRRGVAGSLWNMNK